MGKIGKSFDNEWAKDISNKLKIDKNNNPKINSQESKSMQVPSTHIDKSIVEILKGGAIAGLSFTEPTKLIDDIRNSKGLEKDELLLNFQSNIKHLSKDSLNEMKGYLKGLIENPTNLDDNLLKGLLKFVEEKLENKMPIRPIIDDIHKPFRVD